MAAAAASTTQYNWQLCHDQSKNEEDEECEIVEKAMTFLPRSVSTNSYCIINVYIGIRNLHKIFFIANHCVNGKNSGSCHPRHFLNFEKGYG